MTTDTSSTSAPLTPNGMVVAGTLCQRELVRFVRQRNRVFGALVQPILFWLLFSEGFRYADDSSLDYAHFFPGTLVMILLFTAIFATISIIEDRREGFLQSVLVAPAPRWAMVLGKILGGTALAVGQALIFLLLGYITGVVPRADGLTMLLNFIQVLALMIVVAFALTSLGFLIAWRMDSTQGFHAIMSVFLLPMWLLSGSFFPSEEGVLGWIVVCNPLSYGVAGLRTLLSSGDPASDISLGICWAVSLLFAIVTYALAWRIAGKRTTGDLL